MLIERKEVEQYLDEKFFKISSYKDIHEKLTDVVSDTFKIPRIRVLSTLNRNISTSELSEFELFCYVKSINDIKEGRYTLSKAFTEIEIKTYSESEYVQNKIKFPIYIEAIQITDDQWIGSIDVKLLMKFRAAQMINYNENTQRTLQKIIRGENEYYKIALNRTALKNIQKAYEDDVYIPNTITMNIPEDSDSDFYYDEDSKRLVIRRLDHFDMTDGYHRYVALCRIVDSNRKFNYPMELRVTNFSNSKAQQFIFQEDQKTKMSKLDSNSMNQNRAANIVAERLNQDSLCNIKGMIARNNGLINFADFAAYVEVLWFKNIKSSDVRKHILNVSKELREDFNILTDNNPEYLSKKYNRKELAIILVLFSEYADKDKSDMCSSIADALSQSKNIEFNRSTPKGQIDIVKAALNK